MNQSSLFSFINHAGLYSITSVKKKLLLKKLNTKKAFYLFFCTPNNMICNFQEKHYSLKSEVVCYFAHIQKVVGLLKERELEG